MKTLSFFSLWLFLAVIISTGLSAQNVLPSFTCSSHTICPGETVQFTDLTSNNPTEWLWTLRGGSPNTSTLQNPSATYNYPGKYDVILRVNNAQGVNVAVGYMSFIVVSVCSGIFEFDNSDFRIFPNPAASFVALSGISDAKYILYNAVGVMAATGFIKEESEIKIPLDDLSFGLYILSIEKQSQIKNFKVIKE